jgi:hypothetical protein
MSLHNASKYLASKGRGEDTELVHMTKGEIKGLQQLALAHGGSLTINPETGLVEAGWLKTLLPMVAGAALTVATGGTAMAAYAPYLAALAAGGGMYATTGSVKEGLMAGLGAFGGANIAGGLMAAGAEAGAAGATQGALEATAAEGSQAATLAAQNTAMGLTPAEQAAQAIGATQTGAGSQAAMLAEQNLGMGLTPAESTANLMTSAGAPVSATGAPVSAAMSQTAQPYSFGSNLEQAGRGLPQIGNVIMNAPMKTAGAALAPFLMNAQDSGVQGFPPEQDTGSSSGMTMSSNFQGYTPSTPNPYYQPQYQDYRRRGIGALAEGGVVGMADGGMDSMNPMQNPIYPQSQQMHTDFATSTQYPNSMKSAMASDYDARTNPMTGQELPMGMAAGGVAGYAPGGHLPSSPSMPSGGVYRDTDPDTATKDAYNAALIRLQKINKAAGTKGLTMPKGRMTQLGGSFDNVEEKAAGGIARYDGGGAAAGGDAGAAPAASGIPAGLGGAAAAAMLDFAGLPIPTMANAGLGALSAGAPNAMAQMAAMNPFQSAQRPAPAQYTNPYAAQPIHTPQATTNYQFDTPIATAESIAREEAARKAAEEAARAAAAQQENGNPYSQNFAAGGIAHYNLGGYSDGGRMLRGPGDGMSDDIPASIGGKQPARLADGEFVVPADVVSHLGNGSTDAGAKKLYGMMDKVRHARTGTKKQGKQIKADKYLPK